MTDDYLEFAEDEYKADRLSFEKLQQVRLQIAAEYLLHYDDEVASMKTLNLVPELYIKRQLLEDLKEDSLLAASLVEFIHHLELRGITWHGSIKTTGMGFMNETGKA